MNRAKIINLQKDNLAKLSTEIAKKIIGGDLNLDKETQDQIISKELLKMRSRRKLRIEFKDLNILGDFKTIPELEFIKSSHLEEGFVKIKTETGEALWKEKEAISVIKDALASFH